MFVATEEFHTSKYRPFAIAKNDKSIVTFLEGSQFIQIILGIGLLMFVLNGCNGMGVAPPTSTATVVLTATPIPPTSTP